MDSLPQEIIDEIIDNLPHFSLLSTSLVAKMWQERSQQRAFKEIWFRSESMVNAWLTNIQSGRSEISSYVRFVGFSNIINWRDPALFGRVLNNLNSLTELAIFDMEISEEIMEQILHGGFGWRITALNLQRLPWSLSAVMSTILAFPNLRDLVIIYLAIRPGKLSTHPAPPQRRPLNSLLVRGYGIGPIAEALANHRFASRRLTLEAQPQNIQKLLDLSSAIVVELVLVDSLEDGVTSDPINLPPFPTLTSLRIYFLTGTPSAHLVAVLSSISPVPALTSITLGRWRGFHFEPEPSSTWDRLDRWLAQIDRNTAVEGDLVPALTRRREDRIPEVLLPSLREVGKITTAIPPI